MLEVAAAEHIWPPSTFCSTMPPFVKLSAFQNATCQGFSKKPTRIKTNVAEIHCKDTFWVDYTFFYFAHLTGVCIPDFTKLFRHPQVARVGLLLTKSVCPPPWHACSATPPRWYGRRGPETNGSPYSHFTDRAKSFGRGAGGIVKPLVCFCQLVRQLWITCWKNSKACGIYRGVGCQDHAVFSCSIAGNDKILLKCWALKQSQHSDYNFQDVLSAVGSVFFSWVSVFFSLLLSKVSTSLTSGLSPISAEALWAREKNHECNSAPPLSPSPSLSTCSVLNTDTRPCERAALKPH